MLPTTKVVGAFTELQHKQSLRYLDRKTELKFFLALKSCLLCQHVIEKEVKIK